MELIELDKKRYENFMDTHKEISHFLQSYYWGEFSKLKKNLTPYYLGLIDSKKKIQGICLLLEKTLPLGFSYFYSPRGFILDYSNDEIFEEFTKKVITFIKKKKAIFLKIDPPIIIRSENYLGEEEKLDNDSSSVLKKFEKLGFKHQGFTKNFETMQPRYTFRIDLTQSEEEIYNHISKTTKQRIQKAIKLGTKVKIGNTSDIETFYHLMLLTEDRKDFVSYSKDYYETLYKLFEKNNMVKLFLGYI